MNKRSGPLLKLPYAEALYDRYEQNEASYNNRRRYDDLSMSPNSSSRLARRTLLPRPTDNHPEPSYSHPRSRRNLTEPSLHQFESRLGFHERSYHRRSLLDDLSRPPQLSPQPSRKTLLSKPSSGLLEPPHDHRRSLLEFPDSSSSRPGLLEDCPRRTRIALLPRPTNDHLEQHHGRRRSPSDFREIPYNTTASRLDIFYPSYSHSRRSNDIPRQTRKILLLSPTELRDELRRSRTDPSYSPPVSPRGFAESRRTSRRALLPRPANNYPESPYSPPGGLLDPPSSPLESPRGLLETPYSPPGSPRGLLEPPYSPLGSPRGLLEPPYSPLGSPRGLLEPPYSPLGSPRGLLEPPYSPPGSPRGLLEPPYSPPGSPRGLLEPPYSPPGSPRGLLDPPYSPPEPLLDFESSYYSEMPSDHSRSLRKTLLPRPTHTRDHLESPHEFSEESNYAFEAPRKLDSPNGLPASPHLPSSSTRRTLLAKSSRKTLLSRPSRRTLLSRPTRRTLLSRPARRTLLSKPARKTLLTRPDRRTLLSRPVHRTLLAKPVRKTLLPKPTRQTLLNHPRVPGSIKKASTSSKKKMGTRSVVTFDEKLEKRLRQRQDLPEADDTREEIQEITYPESSAIARLKQKLSRKLVPKALSHQLLQARRLKQRAARTSLRSSQQLLSAMLSAIQAVQSNLGTQDTIVAQQHGPYVETNGQDGSMFLADANPLSVLQQQNQSVQQQQFSPGMLTLQQQHQLQANTIQQLGLLQAPLAMQQLLNTLKTPSTLMQVENILNSNQHMIRTLTQQPPVHSREDMS